MLKSKIGTAVKFYLHNMFKILVSGFLTEVKPQLAASNWVSFILRQSKGLCLFNSIYLVI